MVTSPPPTHPIHHLWGQKVITRSNLGSLVQHKLHVLPPQENDPVKIGIGKIMYSFAVSHIQNLNIKLTSVMYT